MFEIACNLEEVETFEAMRIYIERHGRPYNYMPSVDHLHIQRMARLENMETDARKEAAYKAQKEAEAKADEIRRLEKLAEDRFASIEAHVKDAKSVKDQKLREYLMMNLVATLSDGMIDVCKVAPIDPIDYLAEYIFKKSNKEKKKK